MPDEHMTIKQAAEILGITRQTVYQAIRAGRLPSERILDRVTVRRADVESYKQRTEGVGSAGGRPKTRQAATVGIKRPRGRPKKQEASE